MEALFLGRAAITLALENTDIAVLVDCPTILVCLTAFQLHRLMTDDTKNLAAGAGPDN